MAHCDSCTLGGQLACSHGGERAAVGERRLRRVPDQALRNYKRRSIIKWPGSS